MQTKLQVRLLDDFETWLDGHLVEGFISSKVQALLAYLALTRRPVARATLANLLWSESSDHEAQTSLRKALSNLGNLLTPFLNITRHSATLQTADSWVDVDRFEQEAEQLLRPCENGDSLPNEEQILDRMLTNISLYRGEFLSGFQVRNAPVFEEWLVVQRERLHNLAIRQLQTATRLLSNQGRWNEALRTSGRLLELEPWVEEVHRLRMLLLARTGQRAAAQAQYESCRKILDQELHVGPSPETTALWERIRSSNANPARRLPTTEQLTPFVGREKELAEIHRLLLHPNCRLLTLTGLGGVGKTRLALQTVLQKPFLFLDGVAFIALHEAQNLFQIDSNDPLIWKLALALEIAPGRSGIKQQQVIDCLRDKEYLLILDNFEMLLNSHTAQSSLGLVSEILDQAPLVKLLVTSRERLGLRSEWIYPLEGLPVQEDQLLPDAMALFVQRARQSDLRYTLTAEETRYARQVCALLEGLPLGIELVAARTPLLSCQMMVREIQSNLGFLTSQHVDAPQRHASLRAVFESSWQGLSAAEQQAFCRLAVFRGGFCRDAAWVVSAVRNEMLVTLVNKSLLSIVGDNRFSMHGLLREFAAEKLAERRQDELLVTGRHSRYYTDWLWEQRVALAQKGQPEALQQAGVEIENVRAAWQSAMQSRRFDEIERALEGFFQVYQVRGWFQEGVDVFARTVERLRADPGAPTATALLGRLLTRQAIFRRLLGQVDQACRVLEESIAIFRKAGVPDETALALNSLGTVYSEQGRHELAKGYYQESLVLWQQIGDQAGLARTYNNLGIVTYELGQYKEARRYLLESLTIHQAGGQRRNMAAAYANLGMVAEASGQRDAAKEYYEAGLLICREMGDRKGTAVMLNNLGVTLGSLRDTAGAQRCYAESLDIYRETGEPRGVALALTNLGQVAWLRGENLKARQFCQEALPMHRQLNNRHGLTLTLNYLGDIFIAMRQYADARQVLHESIGISIESGMLPRLMEALAGVAQLFACTGEADRSSKLAGFVLSQKAVEEETAEKARALADSLKLKGVPTGTCTYDSDPLEVVVQQVLDLLDVE